MSRKSILVKVIVYDDRTGEVEQTVIRNYEGGYGYEVRELFDRIGNLFAKLIDPSYED